MSISEEQMQDQYGEILRERAEKSIHNFGVELYLRLEELCEKYFDLVWYGRSAFDAGILGPFFPEHKVDVPGIPPATEEKKAQAAEKRREVEEAWTSEVADLRTDPCYFHGFNKGVLAALRLTLGVVERHEDAAFAEFPMLDT
ncbi:MAG: hypothetical protein ACYSUF_00405 [Planctomycetota bacterium]